MKVDNYELARYHPEDDRCLLSLPEGVEHYEVVSGAGLISRE
jgi:hypothetical protein